MTYNYLLGLWGKKGGGLAIDVSSEPVFLSKKRRISIDMSSGLIFLTKKKKMGRGYEQTFFQRRYTEGQQAYEKTFNITNQGSANQNYNEISPYTC